MVHLLFWVLTYSLKVLPPSNNQSSSTWTIVTEWSGFPAYHFSWNFGRQCSRKGKYIHYWPSGWIWLYIGKDRVVLPSELLLLSSRLGYIITGWYHDHVGFNKEIVSACAIASVTDDHYLSDLWNLDQIGINDSLDIQDDDKALEQFNSIVCYREGCYFVTWMWKPNSILHVNFDIAYGRMRSLSRRL